MSWFTRKNRHVENIAEPRYWMEVVALFSSGKRVIITSKYYDNEDTVIELVDTTKHIIQCAMETKPRPCIPILHITADLTNVDYIYTVFCED